MPGAKRGRGAGTDRQLPIEFGSEGDAPTRCGEALWDFTAVAAPSESSRELRPEPSPALELERAGLIHGLRQRYADACRDIMCLEHPPADSVDRWLLEQLAQPRRGRGSDPLLPKPLIAETSRVLQRELLAEVPLRCPTRAFGALALEALRKYHESACGWLRRLDAPVALRTEVEALGTWIDENAGAARSRRRPEDCPLKQKLHSLSKDGGLSSAFRCKVEPLVLQVINIVSVEAEELVSKLQKISVDPAASTSVHLEMIEADSAAQLRFGNDTIPVSKLHLKKLRALYEVHQPHPGASSAPAATEWEEVFRRRLYTMLRRYVTFIGLDPAEEGQKGGNMHAAAPEPVFAWLKRELGVRCELFASPLNCYFPRFCSAFPDVDIFFGSLGSFFDFDVMPEGSYEVGPPYTEEVIELTARKLVTWLKAASSYALSFVVFVPDWPGAGGLNLLDGADFAAYRRTKMEFALARGKDHHYVSGVQFFADSGANAARRYYVVPHGTRVYVLQNSKGAERWPFTEAKEKALLEQMRPPRPV